MTIVERLNHILRLAFAQIEIPIAFGILVAVLALNVQLAKVIVLGLCIA